MIEGDHDPNNPARLLDCPNCDAQVWPEDEKCWQCKSDLHLSGTSSQEKKD